MKQPMPSDLRLVALIEFFESLQPATVQRIDDLYAPDASFKDPFNEVRGVAAIKRIFDHMFAQVDAPAFRVQAAAVEGDTGFLEWTMHFRRRGSAREETIRGASAVRFDADGRVAVHRDYWDAAEELYAKLPLLGALMRALRRRLAAS